MKANFVFIYFHITISGNYKITNNNNTTPRNIQQL